MERTDSDCYHYYQILILEYNFTKSLIHKMHLSNTEHPVFTLKTYRNTKIKNNVTQLQLDFCLTQHSLQANMGHDGQWTAGLPGRDTRLPLPTTNEHRSSRSQMMEDGTKLLSLSGKLAGLLTASIDVFPFQEGCPPVSLFWGYHKLDYYWWGLKRLI